MANQTPQAEVKTQLIRYVFSDVVDYTKGRSVEAQSEIIDSLNKITLASLYDANVGETSRILLPTGDGICVAITDPSLTYDVHLQLALAILKNLDQHNSNIADSSRRFGIRIGLNENVDNLITDINGRLNVAGAGINGAQRAMDQANENQIFLGVSVANILQHREKYQKVLRRYSNAPNKGGGTFTVFQFISEEALGLNTQVPALLAPKATKPIALTKLAAYYLALSIKHEKSLLSFRDSLTFPYVATLWLYKQAKDLVERAAADKFSTWEPHTWGDQKATPREQFEYYERIDFWVKTELQDFINRELRAFDECFEGGTSYVFASEVGRTRLATERPEIAQEVNATQ